MSGSRNKFSSKPPPRPKRPNNLELAESDKLKPIPISKASITTSKCLHPDTQLLMFFGGMKSAKEVLRGDILMGDDCQPRIVMSTCSGTDTMYNVIPEQDDPFIVTKPHVLTLYNDYTGRTINMPLNDFLEKDELWQERHRLFTVPVEYARQDIKNDPFMIGVLIGGAGKTVEDVIKEYLQQRLNNLASYVSGASDIKSLSLANMDKEELAEVLNHRYVPDMYIYNSRDVRHKLLKGIVSAASSVVVEKNTVSKPPSSATSVRSNGRSRSAERTPTDDVEEKKAVDARVRSKSSIRDMRKSKPVTRFALGPEDKPKKPDMAKSMNSVNLTEEIKVINRRRSMNTGKVKVSADMTNVNTELNGTSSFPTRNSRLKLFQSKIPVLRKDEIVIKVADKIVGEQIKFLAKSLGFRCLFAFPEVTIYGSIDKLPPSNKKNLNKFRMEEIGAGKYIGFTLDGNGRFLLSSCMVTHNTI